MFCLKKESKRNRIGSICRTRKDIRQCIQLRKGLQNLLVEKMKHINHSHYRCLVVYYRSRRGFFNSFIAAQQITLSKVHLNEVIHRWLNNAQNRLYFITRWFQRRRCPI